MLLKLTPEHLTLASVVNRYGRSEADGHGLPAKRSNLSWKVVAPAEQGGTCGVNQGDRQPEQPQPVARFNRQGDARQRGQVVPRLGWQAPVGTVEGIGGQAGRQPEPGGSLQGAPLNNVKENEPNRRHSPGPLRAGQELH
jgi:hypothetical protein